MNQAGVFHFSAVGFLTTLTLFAQATAWAATPASPASAAGVAECIRGRLSQEQEGPQPRLPQLKADKARVLQAYELLEAGTVASVPTALSRLPDGEYIFLVGADGKLIWSPRVPELDRPETGRIVATHLSLFSRLKAQANGIPPRIVAAGEFHLINGRVLRVSNKSGTFRGDGRSLDHSIRLLKGKGLALEQETLVDDYSTRPPLDPKHLREHEYVQLLLRHHRSPEYRALASLHRELASAFPDSARPGLYDAAKIGDLVSRRLEELSVLRTRASSPEERRRLNAEWDDLLQAGYVLDTMLSDGLPFVFESMKQSFGEQEANRLVRAMGPRIRALAGRGGPKHVPAEKVSPVRSLQMTPKKYLQYFEHREAGIRANRPDALSHLPDGEYVYLVTEGGGVIYSPRIPNLQAPPYGKILASHLGMFYKLKYANGGKDPVVVGGGEFRISNGRVAFVNNKAGTFKMGNTSAHLSYGVARLKRYGLKVEPDTELNDYSKLYVPTLHMREHELARLTMENHATEEFRESKKFVAQLAAFLPGRPGEPDWKRLSALAGARGKLLREASRAPGISAEKKAELSKRANLLTFDALFYLSWSADEGPVYASNRIAKGKAPEAAAELLRKIRAEVLALAEEEAQERQQP